MVTLFGHISTGMGYPLACQSVNSLNKAKDARAPHGVLEVSQVMCWIKLDDSGAPPLYTHTNVKSCKPVLKGAPSLHLFLSGIAAHDGGNVMNSGFGSNVLGNRWRWSNASKGLALAKKFIKNTILVFSFH